MSPHRPSLGGQESGPGRARRFRPWIPGVVAAVLALVGAAVLALPQTASPSTQRSAAASPTGALGSAGDPTATRWEPTTPDPEVARDAPSDPDGPAGLAAVSVSIPRIGVDSPLLPLGIDPTSGVLIPPDRYDIAGVLADGPVPGQVGPAIIAGHVDSQAGPGVFFRLEEMVPGDVISVSLSDGQAINFRVVEVAQYPKSSFPSAEVYGPTPDRELRLITCGGDFDRSRRSYLDNIVVFAVRA